MPTTSKRSVGSVRDCPQVKRLRSMSRQATFEPSDLKDGLSGTIGKRRGLPRSGASWMWLNGKSSHVYR